MIEENIRRLRKNAKMSQEDLAEKLSVVRQTVSKWERGLSVPDAEMVIKIAALFEVPVSELLGMEASSAVTVNSGKKQSIGESSGSETPSDATASDVSIRELTEKLAQLNEQLAEKNKAEHRMKAVNKKRGLILLLCFAAVIFSANIHDPALASCVTGGCSIAALLVLYKNLALFTSVTTEEMYIRSLTITTFFNIGMILVVISATALTESGIVTLSASGENVFATAVVAIIIIFSGMISPGCLSTGIRDFVCHGQFRTKTHGRWRTAFLALRHCPLRSAISPRPSLRMIQKPSLSAPWRSGLDFRLSFLTFIITGKCMAMCRKNQADSVLLLSCACVARRLSVSATDAAESSSTATSLTLVPVGPVMIRPSQAFSAS